MSLRIVFVQRSNVERGLAVTTDHSDTLRVYGPRKGQLTGAGSEVALGDDVNLS
jgi:hypothetical protein